jgi:hypothetical protein
MMKKIPGQDGEPCRGSGKKTDQEKESLHEEGVEYN